MAKLYFTKNAREEINDIGRVYMELAGEASSRQITKNIVDTLRRLEDFPLSGHPIREKELALLGFRYVVIDKFLGIYRFIGDTVCIYHIVNGATNYPSLLKNIYTDM